MNDYNALELNSKYVMASDAPGTVISKGTHSSVPSNTHPRLQKLMQKCNCAMCCDNGQRVVKVPASVPRTSWDVSETDVQKPSVPGRPGGTRRRG